MLILELKAATFQPGYYAPEDYGVQVMSLYYTDEFAEKNPNKVNRCNTELTHFSEMPKGAISWESYKKVQSMVSNVKIMKSGIKPVDKLLKASRGYIQELTADFLQNHPGGRALTPRDIEWYQIMVVQKLVRSLGNYLLDTDKLSNVKLSHRAGQIEIYAIVTREGEQHNLYTSTIMAGGYNIQALHLRYITKTTLDRTVNAADAAMSKRINAYTKIQRIESEIRTMKKIISEFKKKSSKELKEEATKKWQDSWGDLKYAEHMFYKDEAEFERAKAEDLQDCIRVAKRVQVSDKSHNELLKKSLTKLKAKLTVAKTEAKQLKK